MRNVIEEGFYRYKAQKRDKSGLNCQKTVHKTKSKPIHSLLLN